MASWRFWQLLVAALEVVVVANECQNARPKTTCFENVMDAMLHGFARNPKDYVGLSIKSTFTDFQAYFHNIGMHGCPRPCLAQEQPCVTFRPDYPGMPDVNWVKQVGIVKHPEWYPDLPYPASDWQIAHMLYTHGTKTCPRPCEDGEEEGHFVPVAESPVFADSEGWLTSTTVTVTETTLTSTRTNTGTFTSMTETTATATSTSMTTATMTTMTIPPPVTLPPPGQHITEEETSRAPVSHSNVVELPALQPSLKPSTQDSKSTTPAHPATALAGLASTERPTQPPTPTAAATTKSAAEENNCFKSAMSLTPLDAAGYSAVPTDTIEECQAHCKSAKSDADIGHFLYYKPLRICHCPPLAAAEAPVGPEFVSGPLSCDILLADSSVEIPRFPSIGFGAPAMTAGAFVAVTVVGAAAVALRRRLSAWARSRNAAAPLDEESGGLEFLCTWPDTDSAVE